MAMKIGLTEARIQVRKENETFISYSKVHELYELIPQSFWFLSDVANTKSNILH